MAAKSEFTVQNAYVYNQRSPIRWIVSHVLRYPLFAGVTLICFIGAWVVFAQARVVIGLAAAEIANPTSSSGLFWIALTILALLVADGVFILIGSFSAENIAARFEADAREELYASLLGKSQAFHDRQRVGDIMARATDDTNQLSNMIVPGATLLYEALLGIIVPLVFTATISLELTLVPLLFVVCFIIAVRRYMARLNPVIAEQRAQFGKLNAGLEETISGIEVVKASARELFEQGKFRRHARRFRDLFVQQGAIEARYLPLLIFGVAFGLTFLHAMIVYQQGRISVAAIIGVMGLVSLLRFPTFISLFAFSLVQSGLASAERILSIIKAETELDENAVGHTGAIKGEITFAEVSFGYGAKPVLRNLSFTIKPGQTVAIVGQTGSGKSALTQLVNRTYDATSGQILIDGVDVREWSLDGLRSQISKIEQDVFLFSRSIANNIAFGAPDATRAQVEEAASAAQAHDFISSFAEGYDTVIGERGVTLSGGQKQRVAIARTLLKNPRILILDDATSSVDSETEAAIRDAVNQLLPGRTAFIIAHRVQTVMNADQILVFDNGQIVQSGTHAQLAQQDGFYRSIYEMQSRIDEELEKEIDL